MHHTHMSTLKIIYASTLSHINAYLRTGNNNKRLYISNVANVMFQNVILFDIVKYNIVFFYCHAYKSVYLFIINFDKMLAPFDNSYIR